MTNQIPPRWYCVDKFGSATLCGNERDARQTAAARNRDFPATMPYTAAQLAPVEDRADHIPGATKMIAPAEPDCATCNDNGMIGGPSYYQPDEGGVACPDCAVGPVGPAQVSERHLAVLRKQLTHLRSDSPTQSSRPRISDLRDALDAAIAALQQQVGWQPIETAPLRDAVLVHHESHWTRLACKLESGEWSVWPTGSENLLYAPTHWAPIPDEPKGAGMTADPITSALREQQPSAQEAVGKAVRLERSVMRATKRRR